MMRELGTQTACGIRKVSKSRAGKSRRIRKELKVMVDNELTPEKSDQTGVTRQKDQNRKHLDLKRLYNSRTWHWPGEIIVS